MIDKLSPINVAVNFQYARRSFFWYVKLQKCFYRFFKKREQFTDSVVASNKTKKFFKLQQDSTTPCIFSIAPTY